jgi:hypothetical protein
MRLYCDYDHERVGDKQAAALPSVRIFLDCGARVSYPVPCPQVNSLPAGAAASARAPAAVAGRGGGDSGAADIAPAPAIAALPQDASPTRSRRALKPTEKVQATPGLILSRFHGAGTN